MLPLTFAPMLYGERLLMAMRRRGEMLGQEITRKDVARVAGFGYCVFLQNVRIIGRRIRDDHICANATLCSFVNLFDQMLALCCKRIYITPMAANKQPRGQEIEPKPGRIVNKRVMWWAECAG